MYANCFKTAFCIRNNRKHNQCTGNTNEEPNGNHNERTGMQSGAQYGTQGNAAVRTNRGVKVGAIRTCNECTGNVGRSPPGATSNAQGYTW